MMRRFAALVVALLGAVPALAQQPATEAAPPAVASVVRITASVDGVDPANRTMTLKGPRGRVITLPAGPEVQGFDQLKVGDVIVVRYVEALALDLKRTGPGSRADPQAGGATKPGERPAAADPRQVVVVADIIGVDPKRQIVTLRVARRSVDVKVPDPNQLRLLKPGDQVEATYTEAVAIAIEPAPKAARHTQLGF